MMEGRRSYVYERKEEKPRSNTAQNHERRKKKKPSKTPIAEGVRGRKGNFT
jgi:hypothetical protein